MKDIKLSELHPHPKNPRLAPREDVVEQIAAQIAAAGEFDAAHALIVRQNASGFEIISGHHRHLAAQKANLKTVPCWVREMSDEDAYMALALNNAQGELCELEVGLHALGSPLKQEDYGKQLNLSQPSIAYRVHAARVAEHCDITRVIDPDKWRHLAEIHAAATWAWDALAKAMVEKKWSVDVTKKQATKFKVGPKGKGRKVPAWIWLEQIAAAVLDGDKDPIPSMLDAYDEAKASLAKGEIDADRLTAAMDAALEGKRLTKLSELHAIINPILNEQQEMIRKKREEEEAEARAKEEQQNKVRRWRKYISLTEWDELDADTQKAVLSLTATPAEIPTFTKQEGPDIEWAQWSWNPITGCKHNCPYCYARVIANKKGRESIYPYKFAPTLHPLRLMAPQGMKVPKEAENDTRYRNVFTGSMSDNFGGWVPDEWIEAVLAQMRAAPQWNFLCLTKFPSKMAKFDIPSNTWMGTTVDCQARVAAAEAAFAKVNAAVKWLSIEPMLTPLKFKHLDRFDWIVIGGSSDQPAVDGYAATPEWRPPFEWILDLIDQARAAGLGLDRIYFKTNLLERRLLGLPKGMRATTENVPAPEIFDYLRSNKDKEIK
jgi:protein gp37/ParB-like chromosome segregation protein Spo0J